MKGQHFLLPSPLLTWENNAFSTSFDVSHQFISFPAWVFLTSRDSHQPGHMGCPLPGAPPGRPLSVQGPGQLNFLPPAPPSSQAPRGQPQPALLEFPKKGFSLGVRPPRQLAETRFPRTPRSPTPPRPVGRAGSVCFCAWHLLREASRVEVPGATGHGPLGPEHAEASPTSVGAW